jgi:hypothetical protein
MRRLAKAKTYPQLCVDERQPGHANVVTKNWFPRNAESSIHGSHPGCPIHVRRHPGYLGETNRIGLCADVGSVGGDYQTLEESMLLL